MIENTIVDHRNLARRIRNVVPPFVFRSLTVIFNTCMRRIPDSIKYSYGGRLRRTRYPYCIIRDGDFVVQVGAPRDILDAGRSRAAYFLQLVGPNGLVLVCEPDPANNDALKAFVRRNGLEQRLTIFEGALWSEPGELILLSSPVHPAANLLVTSADMTKVSEADMRKRAYEPIPVRVATLDNVMSEMKIDRPVRLVSITTNGAETAILHGMTRILGDGIEFISVAQTTADVSNDLRDLSYRCVASDDRGHTYRRT